MLTFSQAFEHMRAGVRMERAGWNGKGMWVTAQIPDVHSKMGAPYLYLRTAQGYYIPWLPSQTDLFASDWSTA